jgi:hypothetical protein
MHRMLVALCSALLIAASCGAPPDEEPPARPAPVVVEEQPAPSPDLPREPASPLPVSNVFVDSPAESAVIDTNPFEVSGRARTFENNVELVVRGEAGVIVETWTTARGEMGNFNPWSASILLTEHPCASVEIEAIDRSAKDGSIRSRDVKRVRFDVPRREIRLWFPNERLGSNDCSRTFPVTRSVPASQSIARLAVEALMRGPAGKTAEGYANPFPRGSSLRGITIRDGLAIVDFDESLQNVGGSCRALAIRSSVENTLRDLDGIDRVEIRAGGSRDLALQP